MNRNNDSLAVGLIQMSCSTRPEANLDHAIHLIEEAVGKGAEIVCLPELFLSRYFCKCEDASFFDLAEPVPGPTTERLEEVSKELGITIIASLFERRAPGLYHNTAAVLDSEKGYIGKYRKMHIPDDPLFYEKFYFTPGDLGFKAFDTRKGKIGTLICWDQWYPEAARLTALQGAEVLFYPTAIGWLPEEKDAHGLTQHDAWEVTMRGHAIANGCYVVAVNRTGFEPVDDALQGASNEGIEFWGQSFVAAPNGSILQRAPVEDEAVLVVELDLSGIDSFRTEWPFFRDRRIDAYGDISHRFIDGESL